MRTTLRKDKFEPIETKETDASICQAGKIQMNTKVKNENPGNAFKMPSRTKSPIRINKHCNALGSTKPLWRIYSIESMDSDTDYVVGSLNLEEILNNYNTWNYLTVGKLISSFTFLSVNLLHIMYIYMCANKMTDVELLLLLSNSGNHLTVCKQMSKSK